MVQFEREFDVPSSESDLNHDVPSDSNALKSIYLFICSIRTYIKYDIWKQKNLDASSYKPHFNVLKLQIEVFMDDINKYISLQDQKDLVNLIIANLRSWVESFFNFLI